jgi:hypothetical protein
VVAAEPGDATRWPPARAVRGAANRSRHVRHAGSCREGNDGERVVAELLDVLDGRQLGVSCTTGTSPAPRRMSITGSSTLPACSSSTRMRLWSLPSARRRSARIRRTGDCWSSTTGRSPVIRVPTSATECASPTAVSGRLPAARGPRRSRPRCRRAPPRAAPAGPARSGDEGFDSGHGGPPRLTRSSPEAAFRTDLTLHRSSAACSQRAGLSGPGASGAGPGGAGPRAPGRLPRSCRRRPSSCLTPCRRGCSSGGQADLPRGARSGAVWGDVEPGQAAGSWGRRGPTPAAAPPRSRRGCSGWLLRRWSARSQAEAPVRAPARRW